MTLVTWMKLSARSLAILLSASLFWVVSVLPVVAGDPLNLIVSNIRETAFVVSWTTSASETGQVQLIGGATYNDDRGANFSGTTHYITVSGLQPNTRYQFDVVSGNAKSDHGGSHYAAMTGASLDPSIPDLIVGQVKHSDGSSATDTLVFFTIQRPQGVSSPLSMLLTARDGGIFHINLSDARVQNDPTRYLVYAQDDQVTIQAIGPRGIGMLPVRIGDPRLRTTDPKQMVSIELRTVAATPTFAAEPVTATPPSAQPQGGDTQGALIVGIVVAALVFVGVITTATLFIWKR